MNSSPSELLPAGADVSFNKIGEAMARGTCQDSGATPMRALVATVVAVGPIIGWVPPRKRSSRSEMRARCAAS